MSDIIIIPQIKESDQDDHLIELDCQNTEESIVTIPPIKEQPEQPESENQDNNSITVIPQIKECCRHNVTLNIKDLKNLVEAAKQDIGGQLGSLATKKEVQDLSDRIPDDVASMQYVQNRDSAIESLVHEKEESVKSFVLAQGYATQDDVNEQINAIPKYTAGDNITIDGNVITAEIPDDIAKEATLLAKVAELKEALNTIDFTSIEQAIQNVEDVTAKETTLTQGVADIIKAVENIDFTDLENSIAEVKNAVTNIDFSTLAKEQTLLDKAEEIVTEVQKVNDAQEIIDQMVAIQLQTIIGDGD